MGLTLLAPFRVVAVSMGLGGVPLKNPGIDGYDAPLTLSAGLHTVYNSMGGQGVLAEFSHDAQWNFRIAIAEEYWLTKNLAACAALSTNPLLIHFGITVGIGGGSLNVSFVDHPVLGWSRGLCLDWAGK
jgi:hypothetical protein